MKKKIIIGALTLVLILGAVTYLINKPISNEFIEYSSAEEYRIELINSIEDQDYELTSSLVYSIANSEYYEELFQEVVDVRYNNIEPTNPSETFYNGLIGSLEYIEITGDSRFEINQVDMNNLKDNGAVYFEYNLDGVAGYYINYYNDDHVRVYDSINECIAWKDKEYCSDYLYLELPEEFPYVKSIGIANINYTIFNSDYKNKNQETIIDYNSNKELDTLIEIAYDLDTIMDEGTDQSERYELQMKLIDIAHKHGREGYGINKSGEYDFTNDGSGQIEEIYDTYNKANENNAITSFIYGEYASEEGVVNTSKLADDYLYYSDMFDAINDSITNYS